MVSVLVIRGKEVNLLRIESTRNRGKLNSVGGSFFLKPKKVVGTHGATRENKRYNYKPLSCFFFFFSNSNFVGVSKRKKGLGRSQMGLVVGNISRSPKLDAILKA